MKLKKVLGCIRKADNKYNLIDSEDKIAVGISGGKDSLTLLYCLALYRQFSKKNYGLIGIFIDVGFQDSGFEMIQQFFDSFQIPVIRVQTKIRNHLEQHLVHDEYDCSLCSRLKKGTLIKVAKEHQCNKIALGHHGDDAIETLLLNSIYGAKLATIPFRRYLDREDISMIRPMLYAYEKDIMDTCQSLQLPVMISNCPKDHQSKRAEMKHLLDDFYKKYPQAKDNFLKMLENQQQMDLWFTEEKA